jgi:predicted nuclease of restriction endonuclease-like (RecB) superfamily
MAKSAKRKAGRKQTPRAALPAPVPTGDRLLNDVRALVEAAREQVARAVNSTLVGLYWHIGKRIREDVLKERRAEYGQQMVSALSAQLTAEYGRGYTEKGLWRMIQFAERFRDERIVAALSRQLAWSHFVEIIPMEDPLKRDFYAEMCRLERWSVRTLRSRMNTMLYERTAISKNPDEVIRQALDTLRDTDQLTPDLVFRDPYFLDFLGLTDAHDEKEMEAAILREMEAFILELGSDFAFVARQKRMSVDAEDYYLDLLFYHRRLRRLVAIDLKLGKFQAADKGQMELYLRWLEAYDMQPGEDPPIGLILCAGKSEDHVTLLRLDQGGIRVAQYLTELPPRELLEKKLHAAVIRAREKLARQNDPDTNTTARLPKIE